MQDVRNWLIAIPLIVLVVFAWAWILMFLLGFIALFAIAWLIGLPFKITQNGREIGYVR